MTTFMEKLAAGVLVSDMQDWMSRYRANQSLDNKPVNDFHVKPVTETDRQGVAPLVGVNGATQRDVDNWWTNKHRELDTKVDSWFGDNKAAADWLKYHRKYEATGQYNRKAMEQAVASGVEAAKRDMKDNSGVLAAFRDGYTSSQGVAPGTIATISRLRGKTPLRKDDAHWFVQTFSNPIGSGLGLIGDLRDLWLSRHYVNKDWVRDINKQYLSSDPVERARQLAYRETAGKYANPEASTLRRQEHGAAHLEGSFHNGLYGWAVNPIMRRMPGKYKANDITEWATGLDTNSQATAYRMAATEDFGEEVARRAEQWLRVGGLGAYATGATISAIATHGLGSGVSGAANAAKGSATAANAAKGSAMTGSLKAMMGISNQQKFIPAVTNAVRTFRTTQPIAEGMRQTGHIFDEGGLATDPTRQTIGAVLGYGGDMVASIPAYRVIDGALVSTLGGMGNLAKATGMAEKVSPLATTKFVTNAAKALKWAERPTKFAGRMLTGSLEATGKFALRQGVAEAYSALEEGIEDEVMARADGHRPEDPFWHRYQGVRTKWFGRPVMNGILNKFDSTAAMYNAGSAMEQQQASIDEMMSDPEGVMQLKQTFGIPDATDEELRAILPNVLAADRFDQSYDSALRSLDKSFDWDGCTDQEYNAKWNSFTPEQRSEALFKAFRNDAATGGYISPAVFSDPNLTQEQKQRLLGIYLQSEDNAHGGTLVGQMFRGAKTVAVESMRKSPQAREACIAYASGIVADALHDPSKLVDVGSGEVAAAVLNEMTPDELKQVMAPLNNATPDQVMALQKSLQANADSPVAQAGKDVIMQRLQDDGNFASQFIPKYTSAIQDGQGISQHDMDKMFKLVDDGGVDQMFGTMDDDSFFRFARWALSDEGSGMLDDTAGGRGDEIKGVFEQAAKARMWDAVKRNPLKNLPAATSLWFKSQGWEAAGDFAGKPGLFYGIMALLLGGAVWLGGSLFGEDDDDYIGDSSDAVRVAEKQREILTKELFG